MRKTALAIALVPALALAQGKEGFVVQQAYAEMQRVSGQVGVIQSNVNDLQSRVSALESSDGEKGLRREVEALRAEVASLRQQLARQREEIVRDLSSRLAKMQTAPASSSSSRQQEPAKPVVTGPHREYVVESGDTLTIISQAVGVPVKKIQEMNGMKNDRLRVGQKLVLPK